MRRHHFDDLAWKAEVNEINLTPSLTVFFIMVIFFTVTVSFIS